jgi:hypothetical protein
MRLAPTRQCSECGSITAYAELCRIFAGLSSGSSILRLAGQHQTARSAPCRGKSPRAHFGGFPLAPFLDFLLPCFAYNFRRLAHYGNNNDPRKGSTGSPRAPFGKEFNPSRIRDVGRKSGKNPEIGL